MCGVCKVCRYVICTLLTLLLGKPREPCLDACERWDICNLYLLLNKERIIIEIILLLFVVYGEEGGKKPFSHVLHK